MLSAAGYLVEAGLYKCVIIILLRMCLSTTLRNVIYSHLFGIQYQSGNGTVSSVFLCCDFCGPLLSFKC